MAKKLHSDLVNSGLAGMYQMRPITNDPNLAKFLGKKVKYKKELLADPDFVNSHGTVIQETFLVSYVQKDYYGNDVLRGFITSWNDTFGSCLNPSEIEIVN